MSDYTQFVQALGKFGGDAAQEIIAKYSELFLSIPERETFLAIGSYAKLHHAGFAVPQSSADAAAILETALAALLAANKIALLPHGLSTIGREQFNSLVASASGTTVAAPVKDEHALAVREYAELPGHEYNQRWKNDAAFRARADAATVAGRI